MATCPLSTAPLSSRSADEAERGCDVIREALRRSLDVAQSAGPDLGRSSGCTRGRVRDGAPSRTLDVAGDYFFSR